MRAGLYSPASATAFGTIAPIAKPVTKRSTSNSFTELAPAVKNMASARNSAAAISTGRRPSLSATTPRASELISMPNSPAPNTGPRLALLICHSLITAGAT